MESYIDLRHGIYGLIRALKLIDMSRQNSNSAGDRKHEDRQREPVTNGQRDQRNNRRSGEEQEREDLSHISGLDPYRLNDLYERSSI